MFPYSVRTARRLRRIMWTELLHIPFQGAVWFGLVGVPLTDGNLVGYMCFATASMIGCTYWVMKARQLAEGFDELPNIAMFKVMRDCFVPVIGLGCAFTVLAIFTSPAAAAVPGLVFAAVAVLQLVNYFVVQLVYVTRIDLRYLVAQGFRRSYLARDLARVSARNRG